MERYVTQILLLLGIAVAIIIAFQRLHIQTSLGYLLVGQVHRVPGDLHQAGGGAATGVVRSNSTRKRRSVPGRASS